MTSREVDVLLLVAAGRTNREIAEELVVSPKTVERHLSNLFVRTGATNRHELVSLTDPHLADDRSKADQARTDRH
ncbi:MAG TPA: helix-turn-helix transcriptional regulator [Microthrixaceae bacterium]|nr:helix-turn-helix transcriptional regulator [Microthrixaceae bacterium]